MSRRQPLDSTHVNELFFNLFFFFFISLCRFSYHNLEHGAEDLGVLRHAADVQSPAEDWRVVILIAYFNEDLGCVGCKNGKQNVDKRSSLERSLTVFFVVLFVRRKCN